MRLGLLAPAEGDVAALGRAAEYVLVTARVDRAVYLAEDGALEAWSKRLVGDDASKDDIWARAVEVALDGDADAIDRLIANERTRLRLADLAPLTGGRRAERMGSRAAICVADKADLREADILTATFLLFGKSDTAVVRRIGPRWFVSPGPLGQKGTGVAIFEDVDEKLVVTICDADGNIGQQEMLEVSR